MAAAGFARNHDVPMVHSGEMMAGGEATAGIGKLVADDIYGKGDELLSPFHFSRFAEGKLHTTSNSPLPWS
jgi:hypothetical protein